MRERERVLKAKVTDSVKLQCLTRGLSFYGSSVLPFDHSTVVIQSFFTAYLVYFFIHVTGDYVKALNSACLRRQTELIHIPACKE